MTTTTSYRLALAVAVFTVLFLVWAIGALGIIALRCRRRILVRRARPAATAAAVTSAPLSR